MSEDKKYICEQYKICIEMADRISHRRHLANVFYLSINTALFSLILFVLKGYFPNKEGVFLFILLVLSLFGGAISLRWREAILSYKRLNTAKYEVILELEKELPKQPYTKEWKILEQGEDPKVHRLFTDIEQSLPKYFGIFYVFVCLICCLLLLCPIICCWGEYIKGLIL